MIPNRNPALFMILRELRVDAVIAMGAAERTATEQAIAKEVEGTFGLAIKEAGGIRCLGVITQRGELRSAMGHAIAVKS